MQQLHSSCKKCRDGLPIPFIGLTVALLLVVFLPPTSSCTEQEKNSLLQFLGAISQDGGLGLSWQKSMDCCTWEGIGCGADGTVTDISLTSKGLEGQVSASLGKLSGLLRLNLSHNMLSGGLPPELMLSNSIIILDVSFNRLNGNLPELPSPTPRRPLQVLNISSNMFTRQFPSTTSKVMNNLVTLNASNNSFTGQIPSHLCSSSPTLTVITLCYNQLSGSIPPALGNCSMLKVLKAGHNNLTGPLPDELFNATSLEYLSFTNNGLHGILDGARIINLRNLLILDLGGNNFSGRIPDSIGQLKRLEKLHLDHNSMEGDLPSSLSNCTSTMTIDLKSNKFSGELTKVNFFNLPNLKTLDLLFNNFTGTIPESIYSCSNLIALRLSSNNFSGQLSPRMGNLKSLLFLSLSFNNFTNITNTLQILKDCRNLTSLLIGGNFKGEAMPEDETIDGFQNLQVLSISGCSLSGKIPLRLSKLKKLEMFLYKNQLSGPIPVYKGPLLQYRITSSFPKVLNLGYNNFTGVVPQEIGRLKSLVILNFSFNSLSGEKPVQLCNLTNLQVLDLSSNHLTGAIPSELNNLHFLSAFNISHNDLEGPIPNGGQLSTFSNSSFEGNPKLCGSILFHRFGSAEAPSVLKKYLSKKEIFGIAFGVFFGGVLVLFMLGYLLASFRRRSLINKIKALPSRSSMVRCASWKGNLEPRLKHCPWRSMKILCPCGVTAFREIQGSLYILTWRMAAWMIGFTTGKMMPAHFSIGQCGLRLHKEQAGASHISMMYASLLLSTVTSSPAISYSTKNSKLLLQILGSQG